MRDSSTMILGRDRASGSLADAVPDRAPFNGDGRLTARQARAYFAYGWRELRLDREPEGVVQATPGPVTSDDSRSPFRLYAETVIADAIARFAHEPIDVVDIGCGGGDYARFFRPFRGEYRGIDVREHTTWEKIRREATEWPLAVEFHRLPAESVRSLDRQVNFSLSSSSLEHVDDPDAVVRDLAALTDAGSYGIHVVPGPWSLLLYGQHGWRRFSACRLRAMFERAGFETVCIYRLGGAPTSILHMAWITWFETGWGLQALTFSRLPHIVYHAARRIRYRGARTGKVAGAVYRACLRRALVLDRLIPRMAVGYAIVVRRRPEIDQ